MTNKSIKRMDIINRLAYLMGEDFTPKSIAKDSGVSVYTFYSCNTWENLGVEPLCKICDATGYTPNQLLGYDNRMDRFIGC